MSENDGAVCNTGEGLCAVETAAHSELPSTPVTTPAPIADQPSVQPDNCQAPSPTATDNQETVKVTPSAENNIEPVNNELVEISKLELEVQKRTHERDNYQKKLNETEKKLAALQASYTAVTSGDGDEITLRRELEDLKNMLTQAQLMLDDRGRLVTNQETQITALSKQVSSLKEVVAITKDLLNIRNMEVKHLQNDVDSMESRISVERERHNAMLSKMDAAVRLNADLKKEYETQLRLFQDLRGKYEQKVTLLSEENKALEAAAQPAVQ